MDKPNFGDFCWHELATKDSAAAKKFYGELLGWNFVDHSTGDMKYTMIQKGDNHFAGIWEIPEDKAEIPPHWMPYINIQNLDDTVNKAQQLGASIKVPQTEVPEYGRFALITDPTGAHIAFWESKKK
jgi:predicted enzyme related to lactoylglutathione lyase